MHCRRVDDLQQWLFQSSWIHEGDNIRFFDPQGGEPISVLQSMGGVHQACI